MSVKAICGNCRSVMFECSSDYLCSDYSCKNCGAVNSFDMSRVPAKVVLPPHQGGDRTICRPHPRISENTVST